MSDNATLAERLLNDRSPAIFQSAREAAARIAELEAELVEAKSVGDWNRKCLHNRIAELEAERDKWRNLAWLRGDYCVAQLNKRITELEAEVVRYRAGNVTAYEQLEKLEARIAELEAEVARLEETLFDFDKLVARIAELEAERDRLRRCVDEWTEKYVEDADRIAELEAALDEAADWIGSQDIEMHLDKMRAAIRARPAP